MENKNAPICARWTHFRSGLHIGLSAPEGAYIVPLSFGYEAGEPARFYVHSAKQGRKVSMIGAGARVGFELDCAHRLGEGESACKHTYFFRSIIGTGMLCPVDDGEEKKRALACIMAHYAPLRAAPSGLTDSGITHTGRELESTTQFCRTQRTKTKKTNARGKHTTQAAKTENDPIQSRPNGSETVLRGATKGRLSQKSPAHLFERAFS